jgi:uncharacterized membrane protein
MRATDIAVIAVCAALYAVVGRLTDFGVTFIGVAFWPAAVIPAIFAALYGPWVGGTSAAIGIFARDMLAHGNPLLSVMAGVPPNFIMFFIIGYVSQRRFDMKKLTIGAIISIVVLVAGLLLPTIVLPAEFTAVTGLPTWTIVAIFVPTVGLSLAAIAYVSKRWPEWRSYSVGSLIGQGIGAALLSVMLWLYTQLFYSTLFPAPLQASLIPAIFLWTFATEIPFVLLAGPPVIKACYNAFPSLKRKQAKDGDN